MRKQYGKHEACVQRYLKKKYVNGCFLWLITRLFSVDTNIAIKRVRRK